MTPFDPWALLAMLQAFYPSVSVAELRRAKAERPEYFAGGTLGGSKGEKLTLPDGRVWDLIFAAGGLPGQQRWQVLDVTDDPGSPGDGLELEPGPLTPIDVDFVLPPPSGPVFEQLVTDQLSALEGSDGVLERAGTEGNAGELARALEGSYDATMEPAGAAHHAIRQALDFDDPIDELGAAENASKVPDAASRQYDEPPPPDLPEPDPGEPPDDKSEPGGQEPPAF